MRKKIFSIILKTFSVILVVLALYAYLSIIFVPKDTNDRGSSQYYLANAINYEDEHSLDIIAYGNSDVSSAIIPMELYKENGITSFLNWGNQQSLDTIVKQVKNDLKRQSPKMIILEVDCIYYDNKTDTETATYGNPYTIPFLYHTRWKELELKDFFSLPSFEADEMKGYMYITKNGKYKYKNYMGSSTEIEPIANSVVEDVKEIKSICDEKGIELLFIEAPSPSSWNMERHNGVKALSAELDIPFIDYNVTQEDFNFDYENNFRDKGNHCNYAGAKKITKHLSKYLKNNYKFENKKNENINNKWKNCLKNYEKKVANN